MVALPEVRRIKNDSEKPEKETEKKLTHTTQTHRPVHDIHEINGKAQAKGQRSRLFLL